MTHYQMRLVCTNTFHTKMRTQNWWFVSWSDHYMIAKWVAYP
jgi:hypothetical protein